METYPKPTNKKGSKGRRNLKDHVEVREKKVGLFLSAELSSAIEECKARVASIVKECRARNRKFRDNEFDVQFDGELCLDGYSEKVKSAKDLKDVQRVTEIFEKPHFFPPGGAVNSNAIRQGSLGDCYFLSALSTVACIPGLINKICVDHDAEVGVYGFIFYRNSGWSSVVIDDMLLTNIPKYESLSQEAKAIYHEDKEQYNSNARKGGGLLLYAKAGAEEETWVPLIEKAYAKFHTNYAHLEGGFTSEALEDLTGGVSTTYMTKDILDTDRFWREEMLWVNRDRLFACGLSALDSPEDDPHKKSPDVQGLYGNHAYAVLRAVECKGKRFVVVRNPWGTGEWNGAWSDGSKEWTPEWLQVLPELNHSFGNDGQFVMEYKDFLDSFESIERTLLFDDSGWVLASSWVRAPLNMTPRAWSYGSLSFEVVIETKTKAILALTRLNDRFYRSLVKYSLVTFEFAVVRLGEKNPIETVSETRPFCSRSVSVELDLEPGPYVVYVSALRRVQRRLTQW
ncbi:cysteine proteinase [Coprinopsis marcescibilis]|uniref:Cysteine proteinase n=1 Tax=Coprinopsis marcescibilis TaxID=230819 RepID=A0A5C3KTF0_COPMA|nr:cysteine proteinase [Coprinopsis marcescibilis]